MRFPRFGLALVLGLAALFVPTSRAQAQVGAIGGVGSDPFSFYYGYYLPHQAYIAAQPTPLDTINAITITRQQAAATDRASLYDPISPYGDDPDLLNPLSQRGRERLAKIQGFSSNIKGNGPAPHYNRTERYFPGLRTGRGPNRNIAMPRYSRFGGGGGGFGMPGAGGAMGMGMPGIPGPR
jgi:hypothetical protein